MGHVNGRSVEQLSHAGRTATVVAMCVCEDQMADPKRVEASMPHVLEHGLGPHTRSDIDQREFVATIDQIDVTVIGIREVESEAS